MFKIILKGGKSSNLKKDFEFNADDTVTDLETKIMRVFATPLKPVIIVEENNKVHYMISADVLRCFPSNIVGYVIWNK